MELRISETNSLQSCEIKQSWFGGFVSVSLGKREADKIIEKNEKTC